MSVPAQLLLDADGIRFVRRDVLFEPWGEPRVSVRLEHGAVRRTLARLVEQHALSGARVSLILPRSEVFLIKSADGTPPEQTQAVLRRQLPAELAEVIWTRGSDGAVAVLPNVWLEEFRRDLGSAGLRMTGVGVAECDAWLLPPAGRFTLQRSRAFDKGAALAAVVLLLAANGMKRSSDSLRGEIRRLERSPLRPGTAPRGRIKETVPALAETLNRVPAGVKLTEMTFDAAAGDVGTVGRAPDFPAVSAFQAALSSAPVVSSARVEKASLISDGGRSRVEFSARVTLR